MKKTLLIIGTVLFGVGLFYGCNSNSTAPKNGDSTIVASTLSPMPDPHIPGYKFPENRDTLNKWIDGNNVAKINAHAWGIWTALTQPSAVKDETNTPLLVFETWPSPSDLSQQTTSHVMLLQQRTETRSLLEKPDQFSHGGHRARLFNTVTDSSTADENNVLVTVKYDPTAAAHIDSLRLLDKTSLNKMLKNGATDIPEFPNTGISLKPTYKVLISSDFDKQGLYRFKAWTGPSNDPAGFDESSWKGSVFIDTTNKSHGDGSVALSKNATPQSTYNLKDFIYYRISAKEAAHINAQKDFAGKAKAGDFAILVAMHVTTKETVRWTWQTFWWAPNAENPPLPSSKAEATARPAQLTGAARHYALATAYTFILPNQPLTGGNNIGMSVIGYNPYLEASFSLQNGALAYSAEVITNGISVKNNLGVRTNCMSCHGLTHYINDTVQTVNYIGDTYIDQKDIRLKGTLKTDFLWSIAIKAK